MTALIDVDSLLDGMAYNLKRLLEQRAIVAPAMIGIRTGGVWLAQRLHQRLGLGDAVGELDISFYRDDFSRIGLNPRVSPSHLPFETEGRDIILVDDVIMSGRTIRAALNEIFDYGRPANVLLVALVDIPRRELPFQPDVCGQTLELAQNQRVKLVGPDPLCLELRQHD